MGVNRVKWGSCSYWMAGSSKKLHQNSVFVQNLVTCFVFQTAWKTRSACAIKQLLELFNHNVSVHSFLYTWVPLLIWGHWVSREPFLAPERRIQSSKPWIELVFNFPDRKIRFGIGGGNPMKDFLSPSDFLGSKIPTIPGCSTKTFGFIFFLRPPFYPKNDIFFALKKSQQLAVVFPGGAGYLSKFLIQVILNQICTSGGSTTRNGPRSNHQILGFF